MLQLYILPGFGINLTRIFIVSLLTFFGIKQYINDINIYIKIQDLV